MWRRCLLGDNMYKFLIRPYAKNGSHTMHTMHSMNSRSFIFRLVWMGLSGQCKCCHPAKTVFTYSCVYLSALWSLVLMCGYCKAAWSGSFYWHPMQIKVITKRNVHPYWNMQWAKLSFFQMCINELSNASNLIIRLTWDLLNVFQKWF